MASSSLRSEIYLQTIRQYLNNDDKFDTVIKEISEKSSETRSLNEENTVLKTPLIKSIKFYKNGIITEYIHNALSFANKNSFFRFFLKLSHDNKQKKLYKLILSGFINLYNNNNHASGAINLKTFFKEDFKNRLKEISDITLMYYQLKKRNKKFKKLVKKILNLQDQLKDNTFTSEQKVKINTKIDTLNAKCITAFNYRNKTNIFVVFTERIEALKQWLNSKENYFKLSIGNYGFIDLFMNNNFTIKKGEIVHFKDFFELATHCKQGLELYNSVMNSYGYKAHINTSKEDIDSIQEEDFNNFDSSNESSSKTDEQVHKNNEDSSEDWKEHSIE